MCVAVWDGDAIRRAGINTHMHVIQTAASGGFESNNSEENYPVWGPGEATLQLDDSRLEGAASTALTWNWADSLVTFQTSPGTGSGLRLHAAAETQRRVIGSMAEEASVRWLTGDRCQKAQLPWVSFNSSSSSLPLASCSSSKALSYFWITVVKRSNCAKWLQMHRWQGGCRQNDLNRDKRGSFWKSYDNFSLYRSRESSCSEDLRQFCTNYDSFTFSEAVHTSIIER